MQSDHRVESSETKPGFRYKRYGLILAWVVGALILWSLIDEWIVRWLWMRQLGYEPVFWRIRLTQLALFGAAFAAAGIYAWLNMGVLLAQVTRLLQPESGHEVETGRRNQRQPAHGVSRAMTLGLSILTGLIFGFIFAGQWRTYFRFHWAQSFAQTEPVFQRDLGFYLFRLPFYELLQNSLVGLFLCTRSGCENRNHAAA